MFSTWLKPTLLGLCSQPEHVHSALMVNVEVSAIDRLQRRTDESSRRNLRVSRVQFQLQCAYEL